MIFDSLGRRRGNIHGLSSHPLYWVWRSIKRRCYNANNKSYSQYGRRGIYVCEEWLYDPEAFIYWSINNGWSLNAGLQIDRIDNNGPYAPWNCRFVTPKENSNNRRTNRYITIDGIYDTISNHADRLGISWNVLYKRIFESGFPEERWTEPVRVDNGKINYEQGYIFPGTFIEYICDVGYEPPYFNDRVIRCRCLFENCNKIFDVRHSNIRRGRTLSCGCYNRYILPIKAERRRQPWAKLSEEDRIYYEGLPK